ncbi:PREDICTED: uncharacterized protein K02A2.6-like [Priapulus caudatus]|uniref:RNA-directed DNA polymerase n=1 Tax=Priapulus caudatus TaxID=37621 RepID=A0ABM1EJ80_PRICU|nr:PREDICTED: uncharacterized protein K02A2.6-like [Priapulus caudatus]
MSSLKQLDIGLFPEFDLAGDPSSVGPRWQKYLKAFRRYANAKGITDDGQKRDLLLTCGGQRLQDLYDTLHPEDSEEEEEGMERQLSTNLLVKQEMVEVKEQHRKLLQTGKQLTLAKLQEIACAYEAVETQLEEMCPNETVHRVTGKPQRDKPIKGEKDRVYRKTLRPSQAAEQRVNYAETNPTEEDGDHEYTFCVNGKTDCDKVEVQLGGVPVKMVIDSGASANIICQSLWEQLKEKRIKCASQKCTKQLFAYGSKVPLPVIGTFQCTAVVQNTQVNAEIMVVKGSGQPLLGKKTAMQLGVLKVGLNDTIASDSIEKKFEKCCTGVGKLTDYQIQLHIDESVQPVAQPVRRAPFALRDKIYQKLEELLNMDIIERVEGPTRWVSPLVVVPKPNGDIRVCVDMRQANKAIICERHYIPTVDVVLHEMNNSKVFSKLDVKWGYHQVELNPESRDITTFVTHAGLFRYKRLMFGISAAPEKYQHVLEQVLAGCGASNISDDIIVHGDTQEEHDKCMLSVLKRLNERGLTLNKDKCKFNLTQIEFMGLLLSTRGVGPTEEKVRAIVDAREPETAAEVRSFLGLVNFSARFIPDFASVSEPMRRLTRKGEEFKWGPEQTKSFKELKRRLANHETLAYFRQGEKTQVIADVGLGGILVQIQDGEPRVVSYASRSLSDVERRYSQTEKEALALVWACEKFHTYLYGITFELVTDHKPLEVIYSARSKPSARIERWVLRLQPYVFDVVYKPGKNNIADALSRLTQVTKAQKNVAEEYVQFVTKAATPRAMTTQEIEEESARDAELQEVRQCISLQKKWEDCKSAGYKHLRDELCVVGNVVLRDRRIVLPCKLRPWAIELAHEGHPGIVAMKQLLRTKLWWPNIDKEAERQCRACHSCQLVGMPNAREPMSRTTMPKGPWKDVAVDFLGPLPNGVSLLVVVDYYSRYFEVAFMRSTTSEKTIEALAEMFVTHGLPVTLSSDNGPQFRSVEFRQCCKDNGIKLCNGTERVR